MPDDEYDKRTSENRWQHGHVHVFARQIAPCLRKGILGVQYCGLLSSLRLLDKLLRVRETEAHPWGGTSEFTSLQPVTT